MRNNLRGGPSLSARRGPSSRQSSKATNHCMPLSGGKTLCRPVQQLEFPRAKQRLWAELVSPPTRSGQDLSDVCCVGNVLSHYLSRVVSGQVEGELSSFPTSRSSPSGPPGVRRAAKERGQEGARWPGLRAHVLEETWESPGRRPPPRKQWSRGGDKQLTSHQDFLGTLNTTHLSSSSQVSLQAPCPPHPTPRSLQLSLLSAMSFLFLKPHPMALMGL